MLYDNIVQTLGCIFWFDDSFLACADEYVSFYIVPRDCIIPSEKQAAEIEKNDVAVEEGTSQEISKKKRPYGDLVNPFSTDLENEKTEEFTSEKETSSA